MAPKTIAQPHTGYGRVMSSRFEDEGIPDPGDLTPEQEATGQLDLTTEPPHDSPLGAEGWGTTAAEQHEGEPLAGRLAREAAEAYPEEPRDVGRLVAPDEGAHTDTEPDLVARDSGDGSGLSAEEAALHLEQ
ncbi:MAG: hypothetical protein QOG99_2778 [Frankiales bacterium]|jgi:hypothetical protein|nr:hypothetical protein [Frankiales bacterium]